MPPARQAPMAAGRQRSAKRRRYRSREYGKPASLGHVVCCSRLIEHRFIKNRTQHYRGKRGELVSFVSQKAHIHFLHQKRSQRGRRRLPA